MTRTLALTLDLADDPDLIAAYEAHHRAVPAEIERSIAASGIERMELYRFGTRLVMHLVVADGFTFQRKAELDANDPAVARWEALMDEYQRRIPGAPPGAKWVPMERIYSFGG